LTLYDINEIVKLPIKVSNTLIKTISHFIESTLLRTKWINDIFLEGRKTAGILIKNELNTLSSNKPTVFCQIGIGINVKSCPSPDFTNLEKYCS
jgi:biotin-(acetyl-CoA carboxylase) ligase